MRRNQSFPSKMSMNHNNFKATKINLNEFDRMFHSEMRIWHKSLSDELLKQKEYYDKQVNELSAKTSNYKDKLIILKLKKQLAIYYAKQNFYKRVVMCMRADLFPEIR